MSSIFSNLFTIILFGFSIWGIIVFSLIKNRKHLIKYGIFFASCYLFTEFILIFSTPGLMPVINGLLVLTIIITYFKVGILTMSGYYISREYGIQGFPLVKKILNKSQRSAFNDIQIYKFHVFLSILGPVIFSYLLFKTFKPSPSDFISELFGSDFMDSPGKIYLYMVIALFEIAFLEEIIFRLAIQNLLARVFRKEHGYIYAILITSALWSMGHILSLDPAWVKMAQIFPLGILLGFLYKKYGIETCILVHGSFNVLMALLSKDLL